MPNDTGFPLWRESQTLKAAIMDMIFLEQVKVETHLGVPDWERVLPQTIVLDIEIAYDLRRAGLSDAIEDTVDYGLVVQRIREHLSQHQFKLVETLAEQVCQLILNEFGASQVKLKVSKPGILPGLKALGVSICRP